MDDSRVEFELTRHLDAAWKPVIDSEIDGATSLAARIDEELPALGRWSATRRVARATFLGSAPTLDTAQRGVDMAVVRLGCVLPGESTAIFNDALGKLSNRANHLYVDGERF